VGVKGWSVGFEGEDEGLGFGGSGVRVQGALRHVHGLKRDQGLECGDCILGLMECEVPDGGARVPLTPKS